MEQQKRLIINEFFSHMSTSDLIEKINKKKKQQQKGTSKEKNEKSRIIANIFPHSIYQKTSSLSFSESVGVEMICQNEISRIHNKWLNEDKLMT